MTRWPNGRNENYRKMQYPLWIIVHRQKSCQISETSLTYGVRADITQWMEKYIAFLFGPYL